jgi:hypothetical protein
MRTKPRWTMRILVCLVGLLVIGGLASASGAMAMPAGDPAVTGSSPSISSDKADYAPGELVTLAGTYWQPSESVHIRVNDDAGSSWSRDVDVTANADGTIADSFNLPDWFVAEYSVRATGASGSVALTSFTDGNVKVAVVGGTGPITETLYTSAGCSGTIKSGFPMTVTIPPTDTVGVGSSESLRLDAPATANGGQAFLNWSQPAGDDLVFAPIAGTNGRSVCVAGFQSGSKDIIANYAANSAPTVTAGNPSVTVNEGQTATNSGNYSDANAGDSVTISASRGTVTKTGTSSGTWSWSFATADGPDQTGPVTITASDGKTGGTTTTTFALNVANVAPTVTLLAANALSVNEGTTQQTYGYTISDPGADTVSAVSTSCGANGTKVAGSDANTNTSGSFKCTFADGPAASTVSASATDSDGATGNLATQAVAVANVAPSVTLTGAAMADEGQTKSYAFTVSDPGQDTFAVEPGFPDCDAGSTNNGTFVAGSLAVNASGGSFDCFFADGPSSANVKIQVRDSDAASDAASQSVQIVAVANVAPTVTAPANQAADEGAANSVDLGSFSDPGPDAPWAVDVDWGDGSPHATFNTTLTGTLGTQDHIYADGPATRTVSVKVTDKNGDSDTETFTVAVANVAPTVILAAGNELSVNEGTTHSYSYAISDPGSDTVSSVSTSCGANGTKVASSDTNSDAGGSFKCTFPDGPDTSAVSASATDSDDATGVADSQTVAVANVAPTVDVSGPSQADEGSTHTYTFTVSDPGADGFDAAAGYPDCDADTTDNGVLVAGTYTPTASGGTFKCFFADGPATPNVKMKVADSDGASGTDSESVQVVNVANVAPTVTAAADQVADEGAAKSIDLGSFTDPGPDSPWAVDVDWGDSSTHTTFDAASTGSLGTRSHTYADGPATRTVTVKVTDENGGSDSKAFTVTVANVAPTADLANDGPKPEGSPVTVSFTNEADPSSGDVAAGFHYGFACSASTTLPTSYAAAGAGASKSCTFPDNGTYVVKGRIFDRDNGYRSYDTSVTVTNVAPTITSFTGTNSLAGPLAFAPSTFKTDFTDPGTLDTWSAGFTWSSGLPSSQTVAPFATGETVDHTFTAGCNRTATVKVTDDDGGSDTKSTSVNVGTGTWLPPLADQPVSDKLRNGQVLPVKVRIADCNGVAVTGLAPVIQLVKGDLTTVNDDGAEVITIGSVSAADTGTTMRQVDSAYMYNLRINVPSADLAKDFTIVIYPYGTGTPQTLRHVIVPTK